MKENIRIQNHQLIRKKKQIRNVWHQFLKKNVPTESANTQKLTNATNFIRKSEPPAQK